MMYCKLSISKNSNLLCMLNNNFKQKWHKVDIKKILLYLHNNLKNYYKYKKLLTMFFYLLCIHKSYRLCRNLKFYIKNKKGIIVTNRSDIANWDMNPHNNYYCYYKHKMNLKVFFNLLLYCKQHNFKMLNYLHKINNNLLHLQNRAYIKRLKQCLHNNLNYSCNSKIILKWF